MTPESQALKPCPFCGGTFVAQGASRDYISVWCNCGARGPEVKFPENCDPIPPILECYAAWNRRGLCASQVAAAPSEEPVADDAAVDRFAAAMKAKLAKKREEGRGGWDGPECSANILSALLRAHVDKGDPLDVGNLAMMLHQRGERII